MVSGRTVALVSAFPGAAVHEVAGTAFPSAPVPVTVPVVLPLSEPRINTGMAGAKTSGRVVGAAGDPGMLDGEAKQRSANA